MGFRMGPCTFDLGWLKTILVPGHHSYSRIMQKATSKDVRITVTYFWMIVSISLLMNFCTKLRTRSSDLAVLCIEPILQTGANKQLNTYHRCRQALLWRFRDSGAGYKILDLRTCVTLHYIRVIYSGLMYTSGKTSVHMVCKTAETAPIRKKRTWKKDEFSGKSEHWRWGDIAWQTIPESAIRHLKCTITDSGGLYSIHDSWMHFESRRLSNTHHWLQLQIE